MVESIIRQRAGEFVATAAPKQLAESQRYLGLWKGGFCLWELRMKFRVLASLAGVAALAGCMTAEERMKMYSQPPIARHATKAARQAVALMAIRVNKFTPELILRTVKDPRYSAYDNSSAAGVGMTVYCVHALLTPMMFGQEVDVPIKSYLIASVHVKDNDKGGVSTFAIQGVCSKEPTDAFPELLEVAAAMVKAEKNRPPPPAVATGSGR